jgi:hypothetical protein
MPAAHQIGCQSKLDTPLSRNIEEWSGGGVLNQIGDNMPNYITPRLGLKHGSQMCPHTGVRPSHRQITKVRQCDGQTSWHRAMRGVWRRALGTASFDMHGVERVASFQQCLAFDAVPAMFEVLRHHMRCLYNSALRIGRSSHRKGIILQECQCARGALIQIDVDQWHISQ